MIPLLIPLAAAAAGVATKAYKHYKDSKKDNFDVDDGSTKLDKIADSLKCAVVEDDVDVSRPVYADFAVPIRDPWVQRGDERIIEDIEIKGGFFYMGSMLPDKSGQDTDPCLIDPQLPVKDGPLDSRDNADCQWANYAAISPACRYAYIRWLASERHTADLPKCAQWLYLYGLERRLLIDGPKRHFAVSERLMIIEELRRLMPVFNDDLWTQYAQKAINMSYASTHNVQFSVSLPPFVDFGAPGSEEIFGWRISCFAMQHRPVPPDVFIEWYEIHPNFDLPNSAKSEPDGFKQLFVERFKQLFPESFAIAPSHKPLIITYHAANPGIGELKYGIPGAYESFNQTYFLHKLDSIVESCDREFSDYYAKSDKDLYMTSLSCMPSDLKSQNPQFIQFKSWLNESLRQQVAMISVHDILHMLNIAQPDYWKRSYALEISTLLEEAGFFCAPDIRYHDVPMTPNGAVVITPKCGQLQKTRAFAIMVMIMRLGALVSQIDGDLSPLEIDILQKTILSRKVLNDTERTSLLIWLHWCLHTPQNIDSVAKQLPDSLNDALRMQISRVLVQVACADGVIDSREIESLEKLYQVLGLDKAWVSRDIKACMPNNGDGCADEVHVQAGHPDQVSEVESGRAISPSIDAKNVFDEHGHIKEIEISNDFNRALSQINLEPVEDLRIFKEQQ